MARQQHTNNIKVNFGLVIEFGIPDGMTREEALNAVYGAATGGGHPMEDVSLEADMAWREGHKLADQMQRMGYDIHATGSSTIKLTEDRKRFESEIELG